ncbi:multidrug effflux MFS transporter [Demequina salsinemoris]|uniref:multidrug effflux MFS transporter n=1 Tax=Demequina salsinemoris TaxID=577470 RepID=UPI000B1C87CD|nr:multidrug effflux MFS transporter [Demequina salsinemoris]
MREARTSTAPRHLMPLLAAFTALVVLTTDVYLPVLPELGADLGTTEAGAAATVSAVLIGIAVGQLVLGPVSDAVGRRLPLLIGGLTYALAHVLGALAPTLGALLALRVVAGLGTAACLVVSRAIVADAYPGAEAGRAFATLGAVVGIAPVLAPIAGGGLARVMDWRGMFLVLAAAAAALTLVGLRALPETLPPSRRIAPRPPAVVAELREVLSHREFLAYLAALGAVGAVLFGYIGASSFVLQDGFGLSPLQYSLAFAANAVGIVGASLASRQLVATAGSWRLLRVGHLLSASGVVVLAFGVGLDLLPVVLAGLFLAIASIGLVIPAVMTLGMEVERERAGAASGLLGICQFAVGAVASPLAGTAGSPWSLVAVMGAGVVAGPLLVRVIPERSTSR